MLLRWVALEMERQYLGMAWPWHSSFARISNAMDDAALKVLANLVLPSHMQLSACMQAIYGVWEIGCRVYLTLLLARPLGLISCKLWNAASSV